MTSINYTFFLSLSIIAIGYILKASGFLSVEHGRSAAKIIFNVTLPALIIKTISFIDLSFTMIIMPVICIGFSIIVLTAAFYLFKNKPDSDRGISMITSAGFNVGLFSFPLIEGLFGSEGLKLMAMFDFGNAFIIFGPVYLLGYTFSSAGGKDQLTVINSVKLLITSIPFMSYIVAILINILNFKIPLPVYDLLSILARSNMALALLTLGLTLNFKFDSKKWNLIVKIVGFRYLSGLTIGGLMFIFLPLSLLARIILLFGVTLPVGLSSIPFAVEFGYDPEITGTINNITIILSFVIMWLFMLFFSFQL